MNKEINAINLRPVTTADAQILYKWRNDPQTRTASHNQDEIDFDTHLKWLDKSLKDTRRKIYIAEIENVPVGTVRSDYENGVCELSWTMSPEFRAKGIGKQMVGLLANQITSPIRAEVKSGNLASSRIAKASGMKLEYEKDGILYYFRDAQLLEDCPLCGRAGSIEFIKKEFTYERCSYCHSLFVANHPMAAEVHAHHSEDYYEAASLGSEVRKGYPSYILAQESLTKSFRRKLDIVRERVPSGKLLDAGAAYGTFLRLANSYYEGIGIEVSQYAASIAKNVFDVDVRVASIEHSPPFQDDFFDVIVMWDIIEHLIKPVEALKEVQRMLKPGGYVFVSTDDADHWLPKLLGSRWWALGAPSHLCHFSRLGMKLAFERAGKYESIDLISDKRQYSIPEIIEHFGVSYQSNFLTKIGITLGQTPLGSWLINFRRPEQFIAIARKK